MSDLRDNSIYRILMSGDLDERAKRKALNSLFSDAAASMPEVEKARRDFDELNGVFDREYVNLANRVAILSLGPQAVDQTREYSPLLSSITEFQSLCGILGETGKDAL